MRFTAFFLVRPAWALSCGYKPLHKLVTANEVKHNRVRMAERGEKAWSMKREPMDKGRMKGNRQGFR